MADFYSEGGVALPTDATLQPVFVPPVAAVVAPAPPHAPLALTHVHPRLYSRRMSAMAAVCSNCSVAVSLTRSRNTIRNSPESKLSAHEKGML